jgi:hypothetical protein
VFVAEIGAPFLFFAPLRIRHIGAWITIALQVLILLTGNYTFFNLLTIALCLFLLPCPKPGSANRYVSMALIAFTGTLGLAELAVIFGFYPPQPVRYILMRTAPFELVNQYGLFASMTTKRDEISIEGSNDGENWSAYTFRDKPEPLGRAPRWVAPHQPRLDWQMWFAALQDPQQLQWFQSFFLKLLRGSPPVLALLEHDPFQGKPPKYLRALVYQYHFTSAGSRDWWKRELRGIYFPAVSLK